MAGLLLMIKIITSGRFVPTALSSNAAMTVLYMLLMIMIISSGRFAPTVE